MLCPDCHSYCENDDEDSFGIFIRDGSGEFANIPCTARNQFNQMSGLKFKPHGRRYVLDVFIGHSTILVGGQNSGVRHVLDGCPRLMCAMLEVRLQHHRGVVQDMEGGDVAQGGQHFVVHGVEEVINATLDIIYTRGVVLGDGEAQMLGLVITIEDGYIGPHFVHRLTPTNITSKFMRIPNKIVQPINLAPKGVVGLCIHVGDLMQLGYHMDHDGRMVFDKGWGVFVAQNYLQVDDAVVFNFKQLQPEQCTGHQHNMRSHRFESSRRIRVLC
ncbi:hypothetical protein VPH35_122850 [Triticum aestivum]